MRPVVVIVADILVHQAFEMPFIDNDHMVEKIAATSTNPAFGNAVLPGTSEARSLRLNAEALHRVNDFLIEVCAAIKDQVFGSRIVGECLAQLLDYPGGSWMLRHVEVKNL